MATEALPPDMAPSKVSDGSVPTEPPGQDTKSAPRKPRPKRPNYNEIHSKPLPLEVYPLPAFIPHNPISIVRIAINLLSHSIWTPKSHIVIHKAYFSPETQSVHITDPKSVRALWEQGFWGKGSLSRSEPQWLTQEKVRRGLEGSKTSAETTKARREERKQFKLERAKAQRDAIEQQQREEGKLDPDVTINELVDDGRLAESPKGTVYTPNAEEALTLNPDHIIDEVGKTLATATVDWGNSGPVFDSQDADIEDEEHLQLTLEEAFFLTYVLGALEVYNQDAGTSLTTPELLQLYTTYSVFPISDKASIAPDNPFLLNYVVFHHFRSLGWVVRPGVKFAVDYLLYLRGPAFHHAEFAIMIIPSYSHAYWSQTPEGRKNVQQKQSRDWWWLHRINRVQTQVMKTLLLVYVEIPPSSDLVIKSDGSGVNIGKLLSQYTIREFVFRRWSPSRNRD